MNVAAHGYARYASRRIPCRCAICREAARVYRRGQRARALAAGAFMHGLRWTYDCGCRCDECKAARSAQAAQEWRDR